MEEKKVCGNLNHIDNDNDMPSFPLISIYVCCMYSTEYQSIKSLITQPIQIKPNQRHGPLSILQLPFILHVHFPSSVSLSFRE
jgi:hypothetical protein